MIKIAITGNIAAGKSSAECFFVSQGYKVIDTDKITHDLLENDDKVKTEIFSVFGDFDIKDENGNISRTKLGQIVFSSSEYKILLEKILHKRIFEKIDEFFDENKKEDFVFVSIPLLFETKSEKLFDKIIFISCKEETRLERLIKRNGYEREYALKRIKSQESEEEKIKKSDFIVYNNGSEAELKNELKNIIEKSLK